MVTLRILAPAFPVRVEGEATILGYGVMVSTEVSKTFSLGSNPSIPTMKYEKFFINNCYYLRVRYEDIIVQICEPMDMYLHNKKIIPNYDAVLEERLFKQFKQFKRMNGYDI